MFHLSRMSSRSGSSNNKLTPVTTASRESPSLPWAVPAAVALMSPAAWLNSSRVRAASSRSWPGFRFGRRLRHWNMGGLVAPPPAAGLLCPERHLWAVRQSAGPSVVQIACLVPHVLLRASVTVTSPAESVGLTTTFQAMHHPVDHTTARVRSRDPTDRRRVHAPPFRRPSTMRPCVGGRNAGFSGPFSRRGTPNRQSGSAPSRIRGAGAPVIVGDRLPARTCRSSCPVCEVSVTVAETSVSRPLQTEGLQRKTARKEAKDSAPAGDRGPCRMELGTKWPTTAPRKRQLVAGDSGLCAVRLNTLADPGRPAHSDGAADSLIFRGVGGRRPRPVTSVKQR